MRAEELKDMGNASLRKGDLKGAKKIYSQSIAVVPTCLAYANRALVCMKQQDYAGAVQDATSALALDSGYSKALLRRCDEGGDAWTRVPRAFYFCELLCTAQPHIQLPLSPALSRALPLRAGQRLSRSLASFGRPLETTRGSS